MRTGNCFAQTLPSHRPQCGGWERDRLPAQPPQQTYTKTAHSQLLLQGEGSANLLSSEGKLVSPAQATIRNTRIMAANNAQDILWFFPHSERFLLLPALASSATTPKARAECFTPPFTLHPSIIPYCATDLAALTGSHKTPILRRSSPLLFPSAATTSTQRARVPAEDFF